MVFILEDEESSVGVFVCQFSHSIVDALISIAQLKIAIATLELPTELPPTDLLQNDGRHNDIFHAWMLQHVNLPKSLLTIFRKAWSRTWCSATLVSIMMKQAASELSLTSSSLHSGSRAVPLLVAFLTLQSLTLISHETLTRCHRANNAPVRLSRYCLYASFSQKTSFSTSPATVAGLRVRPMMSYNCNRLEICFASQLRCLSRLTPSWSTPWSFQNCDVDAAGCS